ncbi:MAG: hypothetical protein Q4D13_05380 [Erysipelotrichaceae bacterium]|nr:hypothetical protein [Erysipelotrichaceae bacterium]
MTAQFGNFASNCRFGKVEGIADIQDVDGIIIRIKKRGNDIVCPIA